jgi:hypothetical protein
MSCIVCTLVYKVRKAEVHKAEPLVPDSSSFDVQVAIGTLKTYINRQVLVKLRQNWKKQKVKYHFQGFINTLN